MGRGRPSTHRPPLRKRLTVRVNVRDLARLERCVEQGEYRSVSAAVRDGISEVIEA